MTKPVKTRISGAPWATPLAIRVIALAALVALSGCTDRTLVGLEAQAAFEMARTELEQSDAGPRIRIIGTSPRFLDPRPLFYVDGALSDGTGMHELEPGDIAKIEVIKGSKAVSRYGDAAVHGVVLITTKSGATDGKGSG